MSLLLEALKALADRPVPADVAAESAQGDQSNSNLAEIHSQVAGRDFRDTSSEHLLESAASAVADSLQEGQPLAPENLQSGDSIVQYKTSATDESVATWAEIWQQALVPPEATANSAEDSAAAIFGEADESPASPIPMLGENLESIFAPWFAAHGLANEPMDTDTPQVETHQAETAESHEVEITESPVIEALAEIQTSSESDSNPTPYSIKTAREQPVDPTWELYDRSIESLTAWGFQQPVPVEVEQPSKPEDAGLVHHFQTRIETLSDPPQRQEKASEQPVEAQADRRPASVNEQPPKAQSAQPPSEKKVRPVTENPQPASMPLAAPTASSTALPSAQSIDEIHVSEPYLRLANRLLQSLRTARPQAIIVASVDEASARTLDIAQLAKAITLSEEGKLLFIQAEAGRPDLTRRLGINPDQHPRWQGPGGELYERIYCSSQGRIDLLPQENVPSSANQTVDPLLIARCKRQYALVLVDVGVVTSEIARGLAPQGDAALLVGVMQHTPREVAVQSNALLRRLGVRTAGCVLMEPRPAKPASRKFSL